MNAISSLLESAQTFRDVGRDADAQFSANMALSAMSLDEITPGLGTRLYGHWAKEQAERAARFQRNSNEGAGAGQQSR